MGAGVLLALMGGSSVVDHSLRLPASIFLWKGNKSCIKALPKPFKPVYCLLMQTERNPRFPSMSLQDALKKADKLFTAAGRTPVNVEGAVKEMDYSSLSGAARMTMAALSGYGLLTRVGGSYRVSEEGIRALRPAPGSDNLQELRALALRPPLFSQIHKENRECSESVLANLLVHKGFSEDGARKAARIYKENSIFAKTDSVESANVASDNVQDRNPDEDHIERSPLDEDATRGAFKSSLRRTTAKVLAEYSIPLGSNKATLVFEGDELVPEDFDELIEYATLFKKQFVRKAQKEREAAIPLDDEGHPIE